MSLALQRLQLMFCEESLTRFIGAARTPRNNAPWQQQQQQQLVDQLYADYSIRLSWGVLNILEAVLYMLTNKRCRFFFCSEFDVMCFPKEWRVSKLEWPEQTERLKWCWKESKWNSANFEPFKSLLCRYKYYGWECVSSCAPLLNRFSLIALFFFTVQRVRFTWYIFFKLVFSKCLFSVKWGESAVN